MKQLIASLAVLLLGSFAEPVAAAQRINGQVLAEDGSGPLPGVTVTLRTGDGYFWELPVLAKGVSDQNGRFWLDAVLPPGEYRLSGELGGFDDSMTSVVFSGDSGSIETTLLLSPGWTLIQQATPRHLARWNEDLSLLDEGGFCRSKDAIESYRFLWMRPSQPLAMVALNIDKDGDLRVVYKERSSDGFVKREEETDYWARLASERAIEVDREMVEFLLADFRARAEEFFWESPFRPHDKNIYIHPSTWVVEGRRGEECHVAFRWSPAPDDPVRRFAEELLLGYAARRPYYDEVY